MGGCTTPRARGGRWGGGGGGGGGGRPGGGLRGGPPSAGADPGPACYGRGGTEPTVTDANLVLGHLSADVPLAGDVALDPAAGRGGAAALGGGRWRADGG